ncbi:hypothetical protein F4808DRAFT_24199 [Astrocystis sublimbata]|nr:hypothetical protein F4808DRAFT_24199 [Astrocystis sublimbata]
MVTYPVCCIAEMPVTTLNKLLNQAHAGSEELVPNSDHELSIVGTESDGSSKLPSEVTVPPLNESFKPFIAGSLEEAVKAIGGATYFAVLDRQSTADDTAVLVQRQDDGSLETARATFKSVQIVLASLVVAAIGFQEIVSIADSQGGVYGRSTETPKKGEPAPRKRLGGD